jgi:hypothetical protein
MKKKAYEETAIKGINIKKEFQNCWEFWNCPKDVKEKCPAYATDSGKACFYLAEKFCPRLEKEYKSCWECPWYIIVTRMDFNKVKK